MLKLTPTTITAAKKYVAAHHRHHKPPLGGLFAAGVAIDGELCGVMIVGRPVARALQDGYTAEITRVCTNGARNACSMLYGAAYRACRALGYRHLVTYTLASEGGMSLRAAGFREAARVKGRSWSCPSRPRKDKHPLVDKIRWEKP